MADTKTMHKRNEVKDKVLFRLLMTQGPSVKTICEKLKQNIKNIVELTEDELCELWKHVKHLLLEAQKLCTQKSSSRKLAKEYTVTMKIIRTINAMALETVLKRSFIPNILLEIVMILHSIMLSKVKDKQVMDEISYLLEQWWILNMVWKNKVITNVIKYLVHSCESSLQHVKRLYDVYSAIPLLKCTEDIQTIVKLVRRKTVIFSEEGRLLVLFLFTLGKHYILGIHNNVKLMLENGEADMIKEYADLYATACSNATEKMKVVISENCLQDIIFHCLRTRRNSSGRINLGKNLLLFLDALHNNKNEAANKMMSDCYKRLLWDHLKAPGSYVRCNAAEVLFVANPVQYTLNTKYRNNGFAQEYYNAITGILKDPNYQVCNIGINGIFKLLEEHWKNIPDNIIRQWLNVLLSHTKDSANAEIRTSVYIGLMKVLSNKDSHTMLGEYLFKFSDSICDENIKVVEAFVKLLFRAETHAEISTHDIVPLTQILDCIEVTKDEVLLRQLIKFMWLHIVSSDIEQSTVRDKLIDIGVKNINALRKLCFHSKWAINFNTTLKLINVILPIIEEEIERLLVKNNTEENCTKAARIIDSENEADNVRVIHCLVNKEFEAYQDTYILIDIVAILLTANVKNLSSEKVQGKSVINTITCLLPKLFKYFQGTPVIESVIFLFSPLPSNLFPSENTITEDLLKQMFNPEVSEDLLLTVLYVFMKWEKAGLIISQLTKMFTESINIIIHQNQENCNVLDTSKSHEKSLELSLRILKHLLHAEYQSELMNKYHKDLIKLWAELHILRSIIERQLDDKITSYNFLFDKIISDYFKEYVLMTPLLHKAATFDALDRLSDILKWLKKSVVPHIPEIDDIEKCQLPINILKDTFQALHLLLAEYKLTPKLCCDAVLLQCSCLSRAGGVFFMKDAFEMIQSLLQVGEFAYENGEPYLLTTVVPNFLCATMIMLSKYSKETIITHTDNLKILPELIQRYHLVSQNTSENYEMHMSYITVLLNTAVSGISVEISSIIQDTLTITNNLLSVKVPYLADEILKILLNTKKYQALCLQVLGEAITSYNKIDMLSALLIIYKMFELPINAPIKRLKNITLAAKLQNQSWPYHTPFDRSIDVATKIVIDAILQQ